MPSSTSSSERSVPQLRWGREWMLACLLALGLLGGWEAWLRAQGHRAGVEAVDESWQLALDAVKPDSTLLVGTSRSQAAIDPLLWAEEFGGAPPLSLQLPGNAPLGVLEQVLEEVEDFHGLVIFDFLPMYMFDGSGASEARSNRLIDMRRRTSANLALHSEAWLAVHVGRHFALRNSRLLAIPLVKSLLRGRMPGPTPAWTRFDRFAPLDYSRMTNPVPRDPAEGFINQEFRAAGSAGVPANDAQFGEIVARFERVRAALERNGARLLVLWLPACGQRARLEERRFPRAQYWDRFVTATDATTIALGDEAEFPQLECYDGSHIDAADAPRFTRFVCQVVRRALATR